MRRREAIAAILLLAWPTRDMHCAAQAQERVKLPVIGYLAPSTRADNPYFDAFGEGHRELGYTDGENIRVETRFAEGRPERLPELAAELVALKPKLIVAANTPANRLLKNLTTSIPI